MRDFFRRAWEATSTAALQQIKSVEWKPTFTADSTGFVRSFDPGFLSYCMKKQSERREAPRHSPCRDELDFEPGDLDDLFKNLAE